jgi:hypothetical protein
MLASSPALDGRLIPPGPDPSVVGYVKGTMHGSLSAFHCAPGNWHGLFQSANLPINSGDHMPIAAEQALESRAPTGQKRERNHSTDTAWINGVWFRSSLTA